MRKANIYTGIVIICMSIFLLIDVQKIEVLKAQLHSSRMFPQAVLIILIGLCVLLILKNAVLLGKGDTGRQLVWMDLIRPGRMFTLALLCAYLILIPVIGFLPATGGFTIICILSLSPNIKKDWIVALLVSGGLIGLIYLVFAYWLQVFLP